MIQVHLEQDRALLLPPYSYPVYIHQNQQLVIGQIDLVPWADGVSHLLNDIIPLHGMIIPDGCPDCKLLEENRHVSERLHHLWRGRSLQSCCRDLDS